jgi:hypothetical protein
MARAATRGGARAETRAETRGTSTGQRPTARRAAPSPAGLARLEQVPAIAGSTSHVVLAARSSRPNPVGMPVVEQVHVPRSARGALRFAGNVQVASEPFFKISTDVYPPKPVIRRSTVAPFAPFALFALFALFATIATVATVATAVEYGATEKSHALEFGRAGLADGQDGEEPVLRRGAGRDRRWLAFPGDRGRRSRAGMRGCFPRVGGKPTNHPADYIVGLRCPPLPRHVWHLSGRPLGSSVHRH